MTDISILERRLQTLTQKSAEASRLALEAESAKTELMEVQSELNTLKRREQIAEINDQIMAEMPLIRTCGERINELSQQLKAELKRYAELGGRINQMKSDFDNEFSSSYVPLIFAEYAIGDLPGVYWAENPDSPMPLHLKNRGEIKKFANTQNPTSGVVYEMLDQLADIF